MVPLPPEELVRAVASVLASGDEILAPVAEKSFKAFDAGSLKGAVLSAGVRPEQLARSRGGRTTPPCSSLSSGTRRSRTRRSHGSPSAWNGPLQDIIVTNQSAAARGPGHRRTSVREPQALARDPAPGRRVPRGVLPQEGAREGRRRRIWRRRPRRRRPSRPRPCRSGRGGRSRGPEEEPLRAGLRR